MFGYRLVRDADYQRLLTTIRDLVATLDAKQVNSNQMYERLIEAEAAKRAAQTMRDAIVTRVNQLEEESATLRHKLTGLPQIAPKIEKGQPLQASNIGANLDLFEDVGDQKAIELRSTGLLHEDPALGASLPFPGARSLTEHLQ